MLWIVEGAVGIVGVDHEVEGFVFFFAAGKKLGAVIVILLRAAAVAQLGLVVGEVPGEVDITGGVADLAEYAGEKASLLKGAEHGGNLFRQSRFLCMARQKIQWVISGNRRFFEAWPGQKEYLVSAPFSRGFFAKRC